MEVKKAVPWQKRPETKERIKKHGNREKRICRLYLMKIRLWLAAKVNTREVELDNDRDAEEEHLMDAVYDAMIKGPHNSMDFQRDFIAEGMDMLNSFDL